MTHLWMEARCDWMRKTGDSIRTVEICHETGPGGFYLSAARAIADTKKAGWQIVEGEWVCPVCLKIGKKS